MPKVTLIAADGLIIVDGVALAAPSPLPGDVRALQWDGAAGHVERQDGTNLAVEPAALQAAIDAHAAAAAAIASAEAAAAAAATAWAGSQEGLLAHNAARRHACETGGIDLAGGVQVATDRESQAMITGAARLAEAEPEEPISFKAESGWLALDGEGLQDIALEVARHVRNAFKIEALIATDILAGTVTTIAAIDALWDAEEA